MLHRARVIPEIQVAQEPCDSVRPVSGGLHVRDGALRGVQPDRSGRRRGRQVDCRPSQPHKKTGGAMRKTSVHWILLGVLALMPAAVLAQQAAQPKTEAAQRQTEKSHAKTLEAKKEEANKQTEEPQQKTEEDGKLTSVPGSKALGMSILGNQEAPKALVIVPWKSSELGNGLSVSTLLDDSRRPVDKEVFMRMLNYYEIRSETARPSSVRTDGNAAAPANAAQRRKP